PYTSGDSTSRWSMNEAASPFAALSLIVGPAVLTNASSILVLSTSNRLARAVDRARSLASQLERPAAETDRFTALRLREVGSSEERALMLLRALRYFYAALASFAISALASLLGAVAIASWGQAWVSPVEIVAAVAGVLAVGALVGGCVLLLRETRIAVAMVSEEAALLREHFAARRQQ
ncbi:MAG: DUF2721 domain-containing protein, partial [Gammaproteobacteria bacterium]